MFDPLTVAGLFGLVAAVLGATVSSVRLGGEVHRAVEQHRWDRARETHLDQIWDEAERINLVIDDLWALDWRVNRYRHNVHCPKCGRFARQAVGFPSGVADCGLHGVGVRTNEWTGSVPIVIEDLSSGRPEHVLELV